MTQFALRLVLNYVASARILWAFWVILRQPRISSAYRCFFFFVCKGSCSPESLGRMSSLGLSELRSLLSCIDDTAGGLHTLTPSELFGCQRKWASLVQAASEKVDVIEAAILRESNYLTQKANEGERIVAMQDTVVAAHLRWLFNALMCLTNLTGSRKGLLLLDLDGHLTLVSSFSAFSAVPPLSAVGEDLLSVCRSSITSGFIANVKGERNSNSTFSTALICPVLSGGLCGGVLVLLDKTGTLPFTPSDEACCASTGAVVGEYLYRQDIRPILSKVRTAIPLTPFQGEYTSLPNSRTAPSEGLARFFSVRIHTQPKTRPQWNQASRTFIRYPTDMASLIRDVQTQLDEAHGLNKIVEERLQKSIEAEGNLRSRLEDAMGALDNATKDAALLRLANQRLMSKSFLAERSTVEGDVPLPSLSPRSPRWNSHARYHRMKL